MLSRRHQGDIASKTAHRKSIGWVPISGRNASFLGVRTSHRGRVESGLQQYDGADARRIWLGRHEFRSGKKSKRGSPERWADLATTDRCGPLRRQGNRSSHVARRGGCRAEPTMVALALPTMVNPTWICPVLSRANATDEGSMQRTKTNRHIFLAPGRDRKSGFATMLCRDGAVFAHHLI